jgi:small-conductance mechanosensitive channel
MKIEDSTFMDLRTLQHHLHLPDFLWDILFVVTALLIGYLLKLLLTWLAKLSTKKKENFSIYHSAIQHLGKPFNYFLPLVVLNISLPLMYLQPLYLQRAGKVIQIALTISFAWILINAVRVGQDYIYHRYDFKKSDNLKERKIRTQLQFIRHFITGIIIVVTIAAVLLSFQSMRKIGAGLLTGVGIGGIIIGFAAQKSLSNLLAGLQIAFTQPIRIDDVLVVEGEWGRVEEITLTYVVVHIWDERRLILPINYFIEKPFQNWTRISAEILGTVFIYTDYTIPVEKIRSKLTELLNSNPLWDHKVNVLQVTDSKEKTLELRALMSARNSGDAFDLRCFVRENLVVYIQRNFPQCLPKIRNEISGNKSSGNMPPDAATSPG